MFYELDILRQQPHMKVATIYALQFIYKYENMKFTKENDFLIILFL